MCCCCFIPFIIVALLLAYWIFNSSGSYLDDVDTMIVMLKESVGSYWMHALVLLFVLLISIYVIYHRYVNGEQNCQDIAPECKEEGEEEGYEEEGQIEGQHTAYH
eukprot:327716_1